MPTRMRGAAIVLVIDAAGVSAFVARNGGGATTGAGGFAQAATRQATKTARSFMAANYDVGQASARRAKARPTSFLFGQPDVRRQKPQPDGGRENVLEDRRQTLRERKCDAREWRLREAAHEGHR